MFFTVDSNNRHAVRKALTNIGMPSADVRNLRNGQLGKALYEAVTAGKMTEATAIAACGTRADAPESEPDMPSGIIAASPELAERAEARGKTNGNGHSHESADALAEIIRQIAGSAKAPVDAETVRRMVAEAIEAERIKPAIIEIRSENLVTKLNGESTHAQFETLAKVVSTRVDGRRLHAWLVGPSGSGKSFLQSQVAKSIGLSYYSTGAIQSKYDLIGFIPPQYNGKAEECPSLMTPFRRAFQFGGLFGWDDVDGSDPRAFVAFNEALSNGRFAFPDAMVAQHADFVAVASANTWGNGATADYVGRNKIDAATLTRFVRIEVGYDEELERSLVGKEGKAWAEYVQSVRKAVTKEGIKVLITPRHTLQGAALLKAGLPQQDVERMTVYAGLDKTTESKIRSQI